MLGLQLGQEEVHLVALNFKRLVYLFQKSYIRSTPYSRRALRVGTAVERGNDNMDKHDGEIFFY